jgi:nucleotide-binding universal stress UspA family protein
MQTILVPLDGSALAEQALPYVRMLAPLSGAKIDMLRVIADETKDALFANNSTLLREAGATDRPLWMHEMHVWNLLRNHAEGYLDAQAMSLRGGNCDVDTQVQIGAPATTIVAAAHAAGADLIAMATHGYRGLKRWTHGSVTDDVVWATTTPVLVVPGSTAEPAREPSLRRIMLTLDGSEFAKQALPLATELAARVRAELILFRAVAPPAEIPLGPWPPIEDQVHTYARNELRALAGELRHYGIPIKTIVVSGGAAEQILATAAQHQVDLIVMATHGYRRIKRWVLGSVASKVLHATPVPLLLVHAGYEKPNAKR